MKTKLEVYKEELRQQVAILEEAGERWLETKASGKSTDHIEVEVKAAEEAIRRLESQITREETRRNR